MAEDNDCNELPTNVESVIKKASEELISNQDGYGFLVDYTEPSGDSLRLAYDQKELEEYVNFDLVGDDDDDTVSSYNHLLKDGTHEDILGNGEVIKITLNTGIGQVVPENYIVLLHYIAYIANMQEPFDITCIQGRRPKRFTLGQGKLLPGLEIGIKTMRHDEHSRFIVKPELAYRKLGCPPRIPPNTTIVFDVHLVKFLSPENCLSFEKEIRDPQRFVKNLVEVKKLHIEGNELFKLKNFEQAINKYQKAVNILHITRSRNEQQEVDMMKYLNKLYTNLSLCYLKCCAFNKVCCMCSDAMKYSNRFSKMNAKLLFNWGKGLRLLKSFSIAKKKIENALKLEPYNVTIHTEMRKLERDREFNDNVKHFTFDDDSVNEIKRLPNAFWEVFDTRLTEFINSDDDVLSVTLNKNPDDIELAKRKASSYDLKCLTITKAGVDTNCIAIRKSE